LRYSEYFWNLEMEMKDGIDCSFKDSKRSPSESGTFPKNKKRI